MPRISSLVTGSGFHALAHGVESYLSARSGEVSRTMAAYGMKLFARFKDNLLSESLTESDMEDMLTAASLQGIVVMMTSTTIPHGMGYPLSHFKEVNHGMSCAIFLGEFLRELKEQSADVTDVVHLCGFKSLDDFCLYIKTIVARNVSFTVSTGEIEDWTDDVMKLDKRIENVPTDISRETVEHIYRAALAPYIV